MNSSQLYGRLQLRWTAVQVGGRCLNATVTSKRFEQVNCSAFVGKICEECSTTTVTAGTFKSCTFVEQGKGLCQAVSAEPSLDALLACKEWIAAIYALSLVCMRLQFNNNLSFK